MLSHFKRIGPVIDEMQSKVDFDFMALYDLTGLSQALENLRPLEDDSASLLVDENKAGQMATQDHSFSQPAPDKRRKSPMEKL